MTLKPGQVTARSFKALVAALDRVFSLFIRRRDARLTGGLCVICRIRPITDCFHWIPRGSLLVRWDPANACGSCGECNRKEQRNRRRFRDVFVLMYGEQARLALEERSKQMALFSAADLHAILEKFNELGKEASFGGYAA